MVLISWDLGVNETLSLMLKRSIAFMNRTGDFSLEFYFHYLHTFVYLCK